MKDYYPFSSLVVFLIILNTFALKAQGGWQQVTSPQSGYDLYGIYFKDINTGVSSKFKTIDGGTSWYQTSPSGNYAMFFPNPNTGYRVGAGISKTTNLGENWITQTNPTGGLDGIYFTNVNTGYACGGEGYVIKTINGGENWTLLNTGVPTEYILFGIYFIDANTGYATGNTAPNNPSVIIKTTNGGSNWVTQNFVDHTGYTSIYFINSNTGIVVGMEATKTTDGGTTWVSKTIPSGGFFLSLYFPSQNTGYSVGYGGTIIKTTNAGENWFMQTSPSGTLNSVYFINDNTGFACGDDGVVLKTTDGGGPPIGIKPISNEVPKEFSLYQNYPNPFNPQTTIRFDVPASSSEGGVQFVRLNIYDILGREVVELIPSLGGGQEELKPGSYEVKWEGSNYPSGIYFYRLTAGSSAEGIAVTKKMLLVK